MFYSFAHRANRRLLVSYYNRLLLWTSSVNCQGLPSASEPHCQLSSCHPPSAVLSRAGGGRGLDSLPISLRVNLPPQPAGSRSSRSAWLRPNPHNRDDNWIRGQSMRGNSDTERQTQRSSRRQAPFQLKTTSIGPAEIEPAPLGGRASLLRNAQGEWS